MKRSRQPTEAQMNVLLIEQGIIAVSLVATLYGAYRGVFTVLRTARVIKDVGEEIVG